MVKWDDVPEIEPGRDIKSAGDLTPQERARAYTWAREHADQYPDMGGVEFGMAQWMTNLIDEVQRKQFSQQQALPRDEYSDIMAEIESWRDWQNSQVSLAEFAEAVKKVAEQMGYAFRAVAERLNSMMNDQVGVLQDLWDNLKNQLEEPVIDRCPSHGRPMKGGRCSICDRR